MIVESGNFFEYELKIHLSSNESNVELIIMRIIG
jgi:hypothetical protein